MGDRAATLPAAVDNAKARHVMKRGLAGYLRVETDLFSMGYSSLSFDTPVYRLPVLLGVEAIVPELPCRSLPGGLPVGNGINGVGLD
jgi:hypothetical protein